MISLLTSHTPIQHMFIPLGNKFTDFKASCPRLHYSSNNVSALTMWPIDRDGATGPPYQNQQQI